MMEVGLKRDERVDESMMEGVLIPVGWSAAGAISQVALVTFDEAEYRIDAAVIDAHDLRSRLRKHVRLRARTRGWRIVHVSTVEVLEPGTEVT